MIIQASLASRAGASIAITAVTGDGALAFANITLVVAGKADVTITVIGSGAYILRGGHFRIQAQCGESAENYAGIFHKLSVVGEVYNGGHHHKQEQNTADGKGNPGGRYSEKMVKYAYGHERNHWCGGEIDQIMQFFKHERYLRINLSYIALQCGVYSILYTYIFCQLF